MARFDVFRIGSSRVPLVIDVQANLLNDLASRVVIPLRSASEAGAESLARLKPVIEIDGENYVLMTTDIGVLPITQLGERITNIGERHGDDISAALDFLFSGF
jgi:toxin CcdB